MGTNVVVYLLLALVGTVFFVLRLLVALFFGSDPDFDTGDHFDGPTGTSFSFFSPLSILAFFIGSGWMGLACRIDWQMGVGVDSCRCGVRIRHDDARFRLNVDCSKTK